jgi:hypothetical protein
MCLMNVPIFAAAGAIETISGGEPAFSTQIP